jgi:hypothetical protein
MNKSYQISHKSQAPDSKKARRQGLTVNSKRIREYNPPFSILSDEDLRHFKLNSNLYFKLFRPNEIASYDALIDKILNGTNAPSQARIGSEAGFVRQTVNRHLGVFESSGFLGSRHRFKQTSKYTIPPVLLNKRVAYELRKLLPALWLYVNATLYNSKEYYTPCYVPNDSPDLDLFDRYPSNRRPCIPFFSVSEKKDRVSPQNYNLTRGGIYEEGDQKGDVDNSAFSEQIKNSMDNCVCTTDPYSNYGNDMIEKAHVITAKALHDKEICYNDDEILEFYEKQLVRLRDTEKEKERIAEAREIELALEADEKVDSVLDAIINGGFLNTRDYAAHKTRH